MKILRSFEEILFEVISWLVFYPLTLWRIVARPLGAMAYSDGELARADDERQYDQALSPPLLLLITVVLVHAISEALHHQAIVTRSAMMRDLLASPQNLAFFRGLVFSLVPLVAAATLLRLQRVGLSRASLKAPFYAQCYLAAPSAIVVGLGVAIIERPEIPNLLGAGLMIVGTAWFLVTQTRWFHGKLAVSWPRAAWTAVWAFVRAVIYLEAILLAVAFF